MPALDHGVDPGDGRDEVVRVGLAGLGHGAGLGGETGHDRAIHVRLPMKKQIWKNWKKFFMFNVVKGFSYVLFMIYLNLDIPMPVRVRT